MRTILDDHENWLMLVDRYHAQLECLSTYDLICLWIDFPMNLHMTKSIHKLVIHDRKMHHEAYVHGNEG